MLSRLALTPAASWRIMIVRPCSSLVQQSDADRLIPGPNYPSLKAERAPERDTVNYPRPRRPDEAGKCRLFCVPEEYFQFFYPKTGVTGPYVFGAGLMTYLFSKEILVCEHEFYAGLVLAGVIAAVVRAMGPNVKEDMKKEVEAADAKITCLKEDSVKLLEESINNEKKAQWRAQGQKLLFDAKRENVAVQLETAFRERQMAVYKAVKSRLDYKLEMDVVTRRFQHQHMLDWIVKNVRKSITPDMEKKSLDQCITDLKGLAARA